MCKKWWIYSAVLKKDVCMCVCVCVCVLLPPSFIGSKVVHLLLPLKLNLFLCPCVCLCMSVCMWVTLKHTVVLHLCLSLCLSVWLSLSLSLCLSVWLSLSLSVQSVQIELAGYDAGRILISSDLHLDNGSSWEAISLFFFLSFPLLEPPSPLSCPPFCCAVSASSPRPSSFIVFLGRWVSWETGDEGMEREPPRQ